MADRVLSLEQARSLLITQLTQQSHNQGEHWPSRKDRELLHEAALAKKKSVVFSDGRKFSIKYGHQSSIAWGEGKGYETVFIKPANGPLIPCGYFHINFLLANKEE